MRNIYYFPIMLSLCAMGGMMVYPTPAIATVAQSPAIKVRGQVIDEQGEPLTGATVRIKGGQGGTNYRCGRKLPTGGCRKRYPFDSYVATRNAK